MAKVYIDSTNCGGQTIFGVTEKFKVSPCVHTVKRTRKTSVIHLTRVKPVIVTKLAYFMAVLNGTRFSGTEFQYQDPGRTLLIQSITGIPGIVEDTGPDAGYAIPISYLPNTDRVICTNIHPQPTFMASGM